MPQLIQQFTHARLFTGQQWLQLDRLTTINGVVQPFNTPAMARAQQIHCGHQVLAAAFIDVQKYGGGGHLFAANPTPAALQALVAENSLGGAAHCMVTIPTMPLGLAFEAIDAIAGYWQQGGKGILGLHLEGPFINPEKRGAHTMASILKPTLQLVETLVRYRPGVLKLVTLAPECCSADVLQRFLAAGIVLSAGHSNASFAQASRFAGQGVGLVTHLFNAMSALHHRNGGIPAAAMLHPGLSASIIPDGVHVSFEALQLAKATMGQRLFYITDAVTPTSRGPYPHQLRGNAYYMPNGTLSGSAISMWQGVNNGVKRAGISFEESLRMASLYPAKALRMAQRLGSIAPGMAPGLVLCQPGGSLSLWT
ncbi:MAG: N-acetylglucosamine-6-phosphate deacetylase [Bacteroidetes bacterium]|nr:MAG: N-acetylglucosamine-6-phosphate deacetylase [Bacteroidota bacterium]